MSEPPDSGAGAQPSPQSPYWRRWRREEATLIAALIAAVIAIIISAIVATSASSQSRADVRRLEGEFNSLRDSVQGLSKADVQRLDNEFRTLRDSLQGITRADVQRLDSQLSALQQSLQGVTKVDVQRLNDELGALRDSLQTVTKNDIQRVDHEVTALQQSLQGVSKADVQRLEDQFSALRQSMQGTTSENKGRVDELERRVARTESRLDPFQSELQRLREQVESASRDLSEGKNRYEQAVQTIQDFRVTVRNLDAILNAREAELNNLVKNLEANAGTFILEQMPIGSIVMWPLAEKPPAKWRICDGQAISNQDAPEFCELFKNAYWTTGGGKVVHVPDLRGYFIRGVDPRRSDDLDKVDEEAPREVGSRQLEKLPQHSHDVSDLRVAGGLWWQQGRNMLLYETQRKEALKEGGDLRTLWSGGGEWNTYQLQGGQTDVDTMALHGQLGPMIKQQGKLRPDNIALHFIIRVQR